MVISNPRDSGLWTPRTQEFTGGFDGREMIDYDINPNEDNDGLSHHTLQTPEDEESVRQMSPKERREKALRELAASIPHISLKPQEIDDVLERTPQMAGMQHLLESGLGVDMGQMANGGSLSAGANAGPIRSPTGQISYQSDIGKAIKDGKCSKCGTMVMMPDDPNDFCMLCKYGIKTKKTPKSIRFKPFDEVDMHTGGDFGDTSNIDYFTASEDEYVPLTDIIKGKRKYKGRRYSDDEESDEDEKKSKKKRKRTNKRKGKRKSLGGGSREPKSKSKRRAKSSERNLSRSSKAQAFHPNVHSHAMRSIGSGRSEQLPLRLRDPVAYQRKLAYEKNRRMMGAMPRGLSHHADTRGISSRGTVIGQGTKLPKVPKMGQNTSSGARRDRIMAGGVGDPLGTSDPLFAKANKLKITQADISNLKALLRDLKRKIDKLTKSPPVLEEKAKKGESAESVGTDPNGGTKLNDEERAAYRFGDTTQNIMTGKR